MVSVWTCNMLYTCYPNLVSFFFSVRLYFEYTKQRTTKPFLSYIFSLRHFHLLYGLFHRLIIRYAFIRCRRCNSKIAKFFFCNVVCDKNSYQLTFSLYIMWFFFGCAVVSPISENAKREECKFVIAGLESDFFFHFGLFSLFFFRLFSKNLCVRVFCL